jgi:hypothetical protein
VRQRRNRKTVGDSTEPSGERAPLRRIQTRVGLRSLRYRGPRRLSWGSRLFRVLICARLVGPLGCPLPLRPRRFRRDLRFLPFAVRRSLSQSASSPRELRSPPEFSVSCPPLVSLPTAPSMGFAVPSSRLHRAASVPRGSQASVPFRPRRFSRPRRLSPPPGLWVYFTPQPRPGFALQGFSLASSRADFHRRCSCPLAVGRLLADDVATAATNLRLDFRALLCSRIRCRRFSY